MLTNIFLLNLLKTRRGKIMRRVLKALVSRLPIGDAITLEDKASIEKAKCAYKEFKK